MVFIVPSTQPHYDGHVARSLSASLAQSIKKLPLRVEQPSNAKMMIFALKRLFLRPYLSAYAGAISL